MMHGAYSVKYLFLSSLIPHILRILQAPSVVLMHLFIFKLLDHEQRNYKLCFCINIKGKLQNCGLCVNFLTCSNIYFILKYPSSPLCVFQTIMSQRIRKYSLSDGLSSSLFNINLPLRLEWLPCLGFSMKISVTNTA